MKSIISLHCMKRVRTEPSAKTVWGRGKHGSEYNKIEETTKYTVQVTGQLEGSAVLQKLLLLDEASAVY